MNFALSANDFNILPVFGRTLTIPIVNDPAREDAETFILRIVETGGTHDVPITIEKNDQPPAATLSISPRTASLTEGATQNFTVTLNPASTKTVTVKCKTLAGGDAVAGDDYTAVDETLTFGAGETTKTCSLATIDDSDSEADTETVSFGLADAAGGDVETDGSGGVTIATGHESFNVSIADNDQPASTLSFPVTTPSVDEGVGAAAVMVKLAASRPIVSDVTVRCKTGNSSAVAPGDFMAVDRLLTFSPCDVAGASTTDVTKTCSIPIIDDALDEAAETLTIEISAPTGGAMIAGGMTRESDTLTILEDASDPRCMEVIETNYREIWSIFSIQ